MEDRDFLCIEKVSEDAVIPTYANVGDAGMDLYSTVDKIIYPGESVLIPIGLKFAIPQGYEVQIRPRSGISLNTLIRIPNAPGTIDSGFRDEVNVILFNQSFRDDNPDGEAYTLKTKGNKQGRYIIHKGDRVAQMVYSKVDYPEIKIVDDVNEIGQNRNGGFGSSGV